MRQNTVGNIKLYDLAATCRNFLLLHEATNLNWHSPYIQKLLIILKQKIKDVPIRIPPDDGEEGGFYE